jgi:Cu+-exporting ATPase
VVTGAFTLLKHRNIAGVNHIEISGNKTFFGFHIPQIWGRKDSYNSVFLSMTTTYRITGMTCSGCQGFVQRTLSQVSGVESAEVDLARGLAYLTHENHLSLKVLLSAMEASGGHYGLKPMEAEHKEDETYRALLSKLRWAVGFTMPIFLLSMSEMWGVAPQAWMGWAQGLLSLPVVFYATWMLMQRAWGSIRSGQLNMFTLVGIGAGTAWLYSIWALVYLYIYPSTSGLFLYFEAATVILTLVLLGQVLEAKALLNTSDSLKALIALVPRKAIRRTSGLDEEVDVADILAGDVLVVAPGRPIPVDGVVLSGFSAVDESMLTGESLPSAKSPDDSVHAGTQNASGMLVMRAQKVGDQTLVAQIIALVEQAGRSKAPIQGLADRVASYFVPAVILIALITFGAWIVWGPEPIYLNAMINAIAVLIIACPCVLGLVTPMSVMVGVGVGAQQGILIKDAAALQRMAEVDLLVVDKTGTLTLGKPEVSGSVFAEGVDVVLVKSQVAGLCLLSAHPMAQAILIHIQESGIDPISADHWSDFPGQGMVGTFQDSPIGLGNQKMVEQRGLAIDPLIESQSASFLQQGASVSYAFDSDRVLGVWACADQIKSEAHSAIAQLMKDGVEVVMLTGDQPKAADLVAKKLGILTYKSQCMPQDKWAEIKRYQAEGRVVAMAGDGINDAPALTQADVGIAMGTGAQIAIESASIALVRGSLKGIVQARQLSRSVMSNIKQNFFWAFAYNLLGIPLAAGVLYPVFGWLLSPMIAAAAMSFSSVTVIANALRLKHFFNYDHQ